MVGMWVKLLQVPYRFLFPAILIFCSIGVYSINNAPFDVVLTAVFGIIGYWLVKHDFEPAPLLLGFVLGQMIGRAPAPRDADRPRRSDHVLYPADFRHLDRPRDTAAAHRGAADDPGEARRGLRRGVRPSGIRVTAIGSSGRGRSVASRGDARGRLECSSC